MQAKPETLFSALFDNHVTAIELFILFLVLALVQYIIRFIIKYFIRRAETRQYWWNASLLKALHWPLAMFIWWLFVSYLLNYIITIFSASKFLFSSMYTIRQLGITACLLWFLINFINRLEGVYIQGVRSKHPLDATTVHAIARLAKVITGILGMLIVLDTLGISIAGLVAFGGIGAAGIAFAAKDLLGNFFGGLLLYSARPFAVGDTISAPDRNIEGTVEEIGWLFTRIRNSERRPITIPNGLFSGMVVLNQSRMSHRRINETIGLRYQDAEKIIVITEAINAMLRQHPDIDQTTPPVANFIKFADSSLNILVTVFLNTTDYNEYLAIQQDIFLKIIAIIKQHEAECAFPTRTVELIKGSV